MASPEADTSGGGSQDEAASHLCRACGLCCDGTLFGYVPITDDEPSRLRHRLPILPASQKLGVRVEQRCAALGPRGCDVYVDRPGACSRFACKLLKGLEAGELTAVDALEVLASVLLVVDRLDGSLPPGTSFHRRRHLLPAIGERMSPELAAILQETWRDLEAFDDLVLRHLVDAPRASGPEAESAEPADSTRARE